MEDLLRKKIGSFLDTPLDGKAVRGSAGLCVGTTIGRTRRENQDRAVVVRASYRTGTAKDNLLAVVCDGMGGLLDGGAAASIAIAEFTTTFLRSSKLDLDERMTRAAWSANLAVYDKLGGRGGTTLSAFCDDGQKLLALNIGDSRVYGFSRGRAAEQISTDDVLGNFIRRDSIDDEQANRLVQYVGMGEGLLPHLLPLRRFGYDLIILATDGVHGSFNGVASKIFNSSRDVNQLVRDCLNLSEITGGSDNGTLVAVDIRTLSTSTSEFPGLSLQFFSAFDRFEIWAPTLSERAGLTQELDQGKNIQQPVTPKSKAVRRPSKGSKKKTKKDESLSLPLSKEDDVSVFFPESNEVKNDDSK